MSRFLSTVPKFSEISEAYYEKNKKERLIIQVKKKDLYHIHFCMCNVFHKRKIIK